MSSNRSEVGDPDLTASGEQNILQRDVPMDDTDRVEVAHAFHDAEHQLLRDTGQLKVISHVWVVNPDVLPES